MKENVRDTLIKAQADYIDFLYEVIGKATPFLHVHNWHFSDKDILKGKELRETIDRAKKLLNHED